MLSTDQARTLQGTTMHGADGAKIGSIDTLYADGEDGHPTFATVHTGLLGSRTHFVPLEQAELTDDGVLVPYDKDLVSAAPSIHPGAELSPDEEERLYAHYGVDPGGAVTGTTAGTATGDVPPAGSDSSGPSTDDARTRSEERLQVGTQHVETGRARLREYVTTGTEPVQVAVSEEEHEEAREERVEPDGAYPEGPGTRTSDTRPR